MKAFRDDMVAKDSRTMLKQNDSNVDNLVSLKAYLNLLYTTAMIRMISTVMIATVIIRFVAIL